MKSKLSLIYFVLLFSMIGCQPITEMKAEPLPSSSPTPTSVPTYSTAQPNSDLDHLTQLAIADLAQRLEQEPDVIAVIGAQPITWLDASLGCPQSGILYAQVQTAGYIIQLEANSERYEYHTDMDNTVFLCEPTPIENSSKKETDKNVEDGWPNQTKHKNVIFVTPTPRK